MVTRVIPGVQANAENPPSLCVSLFLSLTAAGSEAGVYRGAGPAGR
jgi:hypothetical protein